MPVWTNRIYLVNLLKVTGSVLLNQDLLVVEAAEVQGRAQRIFRCTNVDVMRELAALAHLRLHYHW